MGYAFCMCGFWRAFGAVLGSVLLIYCIKTEGKIFRNKLLLFFGYISYPLYLCHQNMAYSIEYKLMNMAGSHSVLHIIVAFVVVVSTAVILWLIDKNMIQKFLYKISNLHMKEL